MNGRILQTALFRFKFVENLIFVFTIILYVLSQYCCARRRLDFYDMIELNLSGCTAVEMNNALIWPKY